MRRGLFLPFWRGCRRHRAPTAKAGAWAARRKAASTTCKLTAPSLWSVFTKALRSKRMSCFFGAQMSGNLMSLHELPIHPSFPKMTWSTFFLPEACNKGDYRALSACPEGLGIRFGRRHDTPGLSCGRLFGWRRNKTCSALRS